jgi:hypothetical protein
MSFDDGYDSGRDEYEMEIANRAIEEFRTERLQSFYKDHKELALKPIHLGKEARSVLEESPSAALVLATSSIEVGLKSIILRPIISGLVHEESLASLVTDVFVKSAKQDGVLKIVYQVLKQYASIDLQQMTLPQHNKPYWAEISEAQDLRNGVVHRAEACSKQDAERVIELAEYLWNVIFLEIIKSIGLHTHDNRMICDQYEAFCEMRAKTEKLKQAGELSLADRVRLAQNK